MTLLATPLLDGLVYPGHVELLGRLKVAIGIVGVVRHQVYKATDQKPLKYDSRFVQQIHAAASSIMDNMAEGYEHDGNKEFVNFLYIAKGSYGDVRSQIIRASDVGFIDYETANKHVLDPET